MPKLRLFPAAILLAAGLALPLTAKEGARAQDVVARVNGEAITLGHIISATASLPQEYQDLPDEVLFQGVLDQLIQQTALGQVLQDDIPFRVTVALENESRALLAGERINSALQSEVTEAAILEYFQSNYLSEEPGREFNAAHILVATEAEAQEIKVLLDAGGDFGALAREKSIGPSGPNGGDLGWFGPGRMVPAFEEAVKALSVGQVSEPLQTEFGWHVIILNGIRAAQAPTLEAVRPEIQAKLEEQAFNALVENVTRTATIERPEEGHFDPALMRALDLLED